MVEFISLKLTAAHTEECNAVAVTGIYVGVNLKYKSREFFFIWLHNSCARFAVLWSRGELKKFVETLLKAAEIPLHVWREDALPNAVGARNAILGMPVDAPAGVTSPQPGRAPVATVAKQPMAVAVEEDGSEQRDPPSSTWFDDLDSARVPLAPTPMPPRGSGPSIR